MLFLLSAFSTQFCSAQGGSPPPPSIDASDIQSYGSASEKQPHGRRLMSSSAATGDSIGSTGSVGGGRDGESHKNGTGLSQAGRKRRTQVAPLLLLRAVPDAVMCQLVLAGWEQSSNNFSPMS